MNATCTAAIPVSSAFLAVDDFPLPCWLYSCSLFIVLPWHAHRRRQGPLSHSAISVWRSVCQSLLW
jgi:hypothetical protein